MVAFVLQRGGERRPVVGVLVARADHKVLGARVLRQQGVPTNNAPECQNGLSNWHPIYTFLQR